MAQLMSIKKNVDVQPGAGVPAIFHCSQGDKGTRIILGLLNNNDSYTIPEGTTAIIRGSRADGTLFTEITADIDTTTEIKFNLTEDMTSVAGPVECEAVMTSGTANVIGTANFIIDVERSPASIGSVFPGTDAAETWLIDKLENEPLNSLNGESVVDAINNSASSGLTEDVKVALLACFEKVAWIDEDGQDYYDALYDALYPPTDLVSISAVYTQSGVVYDNQTLDSLRSDLVVTAHMSDSSTQTVVDYVLSGTLTAGTSAITVSYGGKTTTFDVDVTLAPLYYWDLTESFTDKIQGVVLQSPSPYTPPSGYLTPAIGTNGAEFLSSTDGSAYYALQASGVLASDRTIVFDLYSQDINNGSARNSRIFTTIITASNGADTGLMYRAGSSAWGFYNRTNSAWQMPTGEWVTDVDYFSGKQIKCYIDNDKYWNIYADDVFLFKTSNIVNSNGTLCFGTGLLNSNTLASTANAVMTISSVKIYEGQV